MIGSHDYQTLLPSYILSIADVADDSVTPLEYINEAMDYIIDVLEPLRKKKAKDEQAKVLYNLYLKQANILRIPEHERQVLHELFETFAFDAVDEEWTEKEINTHTQDIIIPTVNCIAFNHIDTQGIIESMVNEILDLEASKEKNNKKIIEGAHVLALSLHKQAHLSINDLYKMPDVQNVLQILSSDANKKIPDSNFEIIEKKLNKVIQPVIDIVKTLAKNGMCDSSVSPIEVLCTFELVVVETLRLFFRNASTLIADELRRERSGYYPRDSLPPTVAVYLSRKVLHAFKYIQDDRGVQSCLGLLCVLGESCNDTKQMKFAVDNSIAMNGGKVTEVTPYPIPEALAAHYQEKGDFGNALGYYRLALDGIRTYGPKEKTDIIVLNACLVQAEFDVKEALKMAFTSSPFFNQIQQYHFLGESRSTLVQQCTDWAKKLGLSLDEARESLIGEDDKPALEEASQTSTESSSDGNVRVRSKHVTIEEPETDKKKKRKKKVKQSKVVRGLDKKAVKGDKSCENCSIM